MTAPTFIGGANSEFGSSNSTTYTFGIGVAGLTDGDYIFVALVNDAVSVVYDATTYNTETWTLLASASALGSRSGAIFGRVWHTGDSTNFNYRKNNANADGVAAAVYRGVDSAHLIVGTGKTRAGAPADTTTQTTALGITTVSADTLAIAILFEATATAESGAFLTGPTVPSGWTQDYYRAQTTTINTIEFAHKAMPSAGATGNATFTYQNVQASNGWGIQIGLASPASSTPPAAAFTSSQNDTVVQFSDTSTPGSASITSWAWDFGDNSHSTVQNPKHVFPRDGSYTVALKVTDSASNSNTITHVVTVTGVTATKVNADGTKHEAHLTHLLPGGTKKSITQARGLWTQRPSWSACLAKTVPIFGAHRGFSFNYPEMSNLAYWADAYLWASRGKLDWIEFSVQYDLDGVGWGLHDAYFDRTTLGVSTTTLPIASMHTSAITALLCYPQGTDNQNAPAQPYLKFSDFAAAYGGKIPIMVEDKSYANTNKTLDIMDANGGTDWWIWKQAGTGTIFPAVNTRGYKSWGYFFDADMASNYTPRQAQWTFVGLDYASPDATLTPAIATAGNWTDGRTRAIGHIINSQTQKTRLLGLGVRGLIVSDGRAVLP